MEQETRQYPNGFKVAIIKKEDLIKTIEDNIIDKNVAYELINSLSCDIAKNIEEERWTSVPYMFTLQPNLLKRINDKNKEVIDDARNVLSKEDYIIFKKDLNKFTTEQIRLERVSKYKASMFASKNTWLYRKFLTHGNSFATCMCYFLSCMKPTIDYRDIVYGEGKF